MQRWLVVTTLAMWAGVALAAQDPAPRPKPKPTPPPTAPPRPAPAPSRAALPGSLLIRVDAAARVLVDGETVGTVAAGGLQRVPVSLGQHIVQARSTDDPQATAEQTVDVKSAGQLVVTLAVTSRVKSASGAAASSPRFGAADGTVVDQTTRLEWAGADNGSDIDWKGATSYCAGLALNGSGWRLPSVDELSVLYQAVAVQPMEQTACGDPLARGAGSSCELRPLLVEHAQRRLRGVERRLPRRQAPLRPRRHGYFSRALCVRGASGRG